MAGRDVDLGAGVLLNKETNINEKPGNTRNMNQWAGICTIYNWQQTSTDKEQGKHKDCIHTRGNKLTRPGNNQDRSARKLQRPHLMSGFQKLHNNPTNKTQKSKWVVERRQTRGWDIGPGPWCGRGLETEAWQGVMAEQAEQGPRVEQAELDPGPS